MSEEFKLTNDPEFTAEELEECKKRQPQKKRFAKVLTQAGPIALCNPSRAQDNAAKAVMGEGSVADLARGLEALFISMCVIPTGEEMTAIITNDWPALARDPEVIKAVNRLSGAARGEYAKT